MKYRAYVGEKEIKDFYIGEKETKQIWGGDVLLWEKISIPYDMVTLLGPSISDEYAKRIMYRGYSIYTYNEVIEIERNNTHTKLSGFAERDAQGIVHYNIFAKSPIIPIVRSIQSAVMYDSGTGHSQGQNFILEKKASFNRIKDDLYSLSGDYSLPLSITERDDSGKFICQSFKYSDFYPQQVDLYPMFYRDHGHTLNDALNHLNK